MTKPQLLVVELCICQVIGVELHVSGLQTDVICMDWQHKPSQRPACQSEDHVCTWKAKIRCLLALCGGLWDIPNSKGTFGLYFRLLAARGRRTYQQTAFHFTAQPATDTCPDHFTGMCTLHHKHFLVPSGMAHELLLIQVPRDCASEFVDRTGTTNVLVSIPLATQGVRL